MKTTPKDFFLWAGAMIALYVSVFSFLALMFEYIDRAFPDPLEYYVDPYSGLIRFSIAALAVLFPAFLGLMVLIRKDIAKTPEKQDLWVRRWALHLTLFVAGITIAIDLVTLVNTYLGGDITARFGLKVLIVLLVAVGGFLHFLADLRGHWQASPRKAQMIGLFAGIAVIATIISGVLIMGTPSQVRMYKLDASRVSDLQSIQWQVVNYWQSKEALPNNLTELSDPISGYSLPVDPETGESYTYKYVSTYTFELCANFAAQSQEGTQQASIARPTKYGGIEQDSWWHTEGENCFTRTIDPDLYPVFER